MPQLTDAEIDSILLEPREDGVKPEESLDKIKEYAAEWLYEGAGEANDIILRLLEVIRRLRE